MPTLDELSCLEREAAQSFAQKVRSRFGERVRSIRVFGSRARREAQLHSDLDLLVLLDTANLSERLEISNMGGRLMLDGEYPFEIAPTVMAEDQYRRLESLERLFPREIERDGIPV